MFRRRHRVKCSVKVTIVSASGLSGDQVASVRWQRGDKEDNVGETTRKTAFDGRVTWNESANINCTFFRSGEDYKPKPISFTLRHYRGEKGYVLGRATLDLSRYVPPPGTSDPVTHNELLVVKNTAKTKVSTLNVTIVTTYLSASAMDTEDPSDTSAMTTGGGDDDDDNDDSGLGKEDPFADKDKDKDSKSKERDKAREKEEKAREKEAQKKRRAYPRKGSLAASTPAPFVAESNGVNFGGGGGSNGGDSSVSSALVVAVLQAALSREFVPPGMPKAAHVILSSLATAKVLASPALALQQFKGVLGVCRCAHGWDYVSVMGWVSCAVWLVREVTPRIAGRAAKEPICVADEAGAKALSQGSPILCELRLFLRDTFMSAIERGFQSLRVAVQLITDIPGLSINAKRALDLQSPLQRGEFIRVQPGLVQMYRSQKLTAVAVLDEAQNAMSEAQVPIDVRVQYVVQMCHFVNASVMNMALTEPALSTPQAALQIKFEMSLIEEWLCKEPRYLVASSRLAQTRDWANLVVMGKDILLDDALVKSTFPTLTWKQIYRTLVNISDVEKLGKYSVEKASSEVIRKVLSYSQANQNQRIPGQNDDPYYMFYDIL